MEVLKDKVLIRHLNEDEYVQAVEHNGKLTRHLASYQLTAKGIEFLEDKEIPF